MTLKILLLRSGYMVISLSCFLLGIGCMFTSNFQGTLNDMKNVISIFFFTFTSRFSQNWISTHKKNAPFYKYYLYINDYGRYLFLQLIYCLVFLKTMLFSNCNTYWMVIFCCCVVILMVEINYSYYNSDKLLWVDFTFVYLNWSSANNSSYNTSELLCLLLIMESFAYIWFCWQGCSWSVIFVDLDAHNRNRQTLSSLLPRESRSHVSECCPWNLCIWFTMHYHLITLNVILCCKLKIKPWRNVWL